MISIHTGTRKLYSQKKGTHSPEHQNLNYTMINNSGVRYRTGRPLRKLSLGHKSSPSPHVGGPKGRQDTSTVPSLSIDS